RPANARSHRQSGFLRAVSCVCLLFLWVPTPHLRASFQMEMTMQGPEFNNQSTTLVIGAGELGMAVIEALCARGLAADGSLSVLLRPARGNEPSEARMRLHGLGLRIVEADL